jgi:hypothetical protein
MEKKRKAGLAVFAVIGVLIAVVLFFASKNNTTISYNESLVAKSESV